MSPLSKKFLIPLIVFIVLMIVGVFLYVQYLKAEIRSGTDFRMEEGAF